jgi:hypothetical protein
MPRSVGLGRQRLPGASAFEKPSKKITKSRRNVDRIPKIEAYESSERGRNMEGKRLKHIIGGNQARVEVAVLTI